MARIPDDEIERLKREVSVESLAVARGVKLTRTGANLIGLCCFHADSQPSLVITPETNLWHCLGACQAGGSVIDWVMKAEGASFRHAVELLRGGADLSRSTRESASVPKHGLRRKLEPLAPRGTGETELLARVVDYYHATLQASGRPLEYLRERGLEHAEMVKHFKLGFSDRTLGYRLPQRMTMHGAELRLKLEDLGVYRETSGHEHLRGSVVVPLFDAEGRVVQLYGRKVQDNVPTGTPLHLYLPGPHRGVFNRQAIRAGEEMIVCEAIFDALTFWCAGYRNVTSGYGVEGVTDELIDALVDGGVKVVRIAFDRDEAGNRGAGKLSERLGARGITTYRVWFPHGMDANEFAKKVGPAEKSLGLVLQQAEWMQGAERATKIFFLAAALPMPGEEATGEATAATDVVARPTIVSVEEHAGEVKDDEGEAVTADTAERPPEPEDAPSEPAREPAPPPVAALPPRPGGTAVPGRPRVEKRGDELVLAFGDRSWRVRSVGKSSSLGELRVNLLVTRERVGGATFFVDTLELYAAKQRAFFVKQAAEELEVEERVLSRELGQIVLELEAERESRAAEATKPRAGPTMTELERDEALELLRDPKLLERVLADLHRAGVVGEESNKLVSYLAATSRKLDEPLAIVIQSSSAAGKTSLMDSVLALIPEEERIQYSAMTGQSLFYMGAQDLKHKVLAIVEEEGAEKASYALKLLQSEGELTIASAGKDPTTGKHVTHEYRVEGPVMIFLTTTAIEVDEELMNRCLVLAVDEGRDQTRAIHARQRVARTLAGQIEGEERRQIRKLHRNAQRLLKPMRIVNPFATELCFPDHTTRTRRDHMKYLTLISAVTLLHQHQRPVKSLEHRGQRLEYIEATRRDVEVATKLAHDVLGRSLDELPPQTRRLLHAVEALVHERMAAEGVERCYVRFTRRELRERTAWGNSQLKVHLGRLEELELVLMHRSRGPLVQYELRYGGEGKNGQPFVLGLIDYEGDRPWPNGDRPALGRVPAGPRPGTGRPQETLERSDRKAANGAMTHLNGESRSVAAGEK